MLLLVLLISLISPSSPKGKTDEVGDNNDIIARANMVVVDSPIPSNRPAASSRDRTKGSTTWCIDVKIRRGRSANRRVARASGRGWICVLVIITIYVGKAGRISWEMEEYPRKWRSILGKGGGW